MKKVISIFLVLFCTVVLTGCMDRPKSDAEKILDDVKSGKYTMDTKKDTKKKQLICTFRGMENGVSMVSTWTVNFDKDEYATDFYMTTDYSLSNDYYNQLENKSQTMREWEKEIKKQFIDGWLYEYNEYTIDTYINRNTVTVNVSDDFTKEFENDKSSLISIRNRIESNGFSCREDYVK